jgi:hypothetical protein
MERDTPEDTFRERLFGYYDELVAQGKHPEEAGDHAAHYFGLKRSDVAEMLGSRNFGAL